MYIQYDKFQLFILIVYLKTIYFSRNRDKISSPVDITYYNRVNNNIQ